MKIRTAVFAVTLLNCAQLQFSCADGEIYYPPRYEQRPNHEIVRDSNDLVRELAATRMRIHRLLERSNHSQSFYRELQPMPDHPPYWRGRPLAMPRVVEAHGPPPPLPLREYPPIKAPERYYAPIKIQGPIGRAIRPSELPRQVPPPPPPVVPQRVVRAVVLDVPPPPAPLAQNKGKDTKQESSISAIEPCCSTVKTGKINEDTHYFFMKDSDRYDPYTTGPLEAPRAEDRVVNGRDYDYTPAVELGNELQIPKRILYQIPLQQKDEDSSHYYKRRLEEILTSAGNQSLLANASEIGRGSQSRVFMLRETDEVVKIRTPDPWQFGLEEATLQARRDIALMSVYEDCANRFFQIENGERKRIVESVPYVNTHNELQKGVFRQRAVHGVTAYQLAIKVSEARQGKQEAQDFLVEKMHFKDWKEAEHKIRLLEAFYAETHYDVIAFETHNGIPATIAGRVRAPAGRDHDAIPVGFDYNQGQNVMWDPEAKIFKAIDY